MDLDLILKSRFNGNCFSLSSKVMDMLLTSGSSGDRGRDSWEGERRENVYTSKFTSHQNYTSQRNGSFVPISKLSLRIIQDF